MGAEDEESPRELLMKSALELTQIMDRTEADEADGVVLKAVIELSVAFTR
jgi:hypothetical protein